MVINKNFITSNNHKPKNCSYDAEGNLLTKMEQKPPVPVRLQWDFSDIELVKKIDEAYSDGLKLVNVSLSLLPKVALRRTSSFI